MKYLKLFENHLSEDDVAKICRLYGIRNWTLNSDGTVDVDGNVWLYDCDLTKFPLNFGRIDGYFYSDKNNLTSLEGCPHYVDADFYCGGNQLTSLEGCPKYVGGNFNCNSNNIRTFEGIGHIGRGFSCSSNPIFLFCRLFDDKSKIETFNEWGVIQDDKVILYRLNDFLQEIGKEDVTEKQINQIKKYYTVI